MLSAALNIDTMRLDPVSSGKRSILQSLRGHYYSTYRCVRERELEDMSAWHGFSGLLLGVLLLGGSRLCIDCCQIMQHV